MGTAKTVICRMCGKSYTPRKSRCQPWCNIACSIECYKEYLEYITESRRVKTEATAEVIIEPVVLDENPYGDGSTTFGMALSYD